jgi:ATP-dependent RNA helicase SUPV3L1/SUV3
LKPAARALASLLWAEKQDNVDMSALSGAQHLASSGRTSFPVDKALHRDAYRVLGYRQCGERAVRVDILERLADLIRPALAWRESSPGEKPTGAFDGRGFVVTQAMTSLTGSAGEDFASILRALGYRMDSGRRLPPKPAPVEVVETSPLRRAGRGERREQRPRRRGRSRRRKCLPAVSSGVRAAQRHAGAVASEEPRLWSSTQPLNRAEAANRAPPRQRRSGSAREARRAPPRAAPVWKRREALRSALLKRPSETEDAGRAVLVEVWRPAAVFDERRPHHDRNRQRHHARPAEGAAAAAGGEGAEGAPREQRHRRGRRNNEFRKPARVRRPDATATPAAAVEGAPAAEARQGRPPRERFEGKGRDGDRRDKFDRNKGDRNKGGGDRDKGERGGRDFGGRDKGGRDKRDSGPRTVSGRPARRRASATVRSIPIRHLQNWRR